MIADTQRQKEVAEEFIEEHENDCCSDATQNSTARVTDAERRGDEDHDQTGPG